MAVLFQRVAETLQQVKTQLQGKSLYLLTLHSDLDEIFSGGTEGHVRRLRLLLLQENHAVLTLTPRHRKKRQFVLRGMLGSKIFLEEFFHEGSLADLIVLLEHFVDRLHVHHAKKWPREGLNALVKCAIPVKILSVHDFWFLCPSVTLMTDSHHERFCEVESDLNKCNHCLATKWKYAQKTQETIQAYRQFTLQLIQSFDRILFPSASLLPYFQKAYGHSWSLLEAKKAVLPHDLSYLSEFHPNSDTTQPKKRIYFLGKLSFVKGSDVLLEAIPALEKSGFTIEILGSIMPDHHPHLKNVKITLYKSPQELFQLLKEKGEPDLFGMISIWAETFSYVFYEGLFLTKNSIPIVGPFGHPALMCRENQIGVVMQACTADAANQAYAEREQYKAKRESYVKQLREHVAKISYIAEYEKITTLQPHVLNKAVKLTDNFLIQASEANARRLKSSNSWRNQLQQLRERLKERLSRLSRRLKFFSLQ